MEVFKVDYRFLLVHEDKFCYVYCTIIFINFVRYSECHSSLAAIFFFWSKWLNIVLFVFHFGIVLIPFK